MRCPGCISILRETASQGHSDACRKRLDKEMEETQKSKNAKARMREYVDKKMEEVEQARKRKKDEKEERSEEVNDTMNVEGDRTMEETSPR